MNDLPQIDPTEVALQHIVLALVALFARSNPQPEQWLSEFAAIVERQIDAYDPHEVPDQEAHGLRTLVREDARRLLASIAPRPRPFSA